MLYGFEGNDTINGMAGADTIYGGDGDDRITGGLGVDSLWGGNGNDTFIDTTAGLNGDKINDFTVGDKIIITDANIATFTYSLSGSVLTYTGGSATIGSQPGKIVASAAPGGVVQLQVQMAPVGTEDQIANELTSGYWNGDVHHWAVSQGGTITVDIHTLTADEQNVARTALSEWTDLIGVHFAEVPSGGQIVFSDAEGTDGSAVAQESGSWSNGIISSANIQISSNFYSFTSSNSDRLQTYLHEIGHALGLGHAGNYNDTAAFAVDALFQNDAWSTSIIRVRS